MRDYILRSENSVEPNYPQDGQPAQPGISSAPTGAIAPDLRNVVEPSVDWQFSRQGTVGLLYRNNILRNDDNIVYEDSTENYVRPYVSYWLNQRNNIALDYGFTSGTYSREVGLHTPDFTSQSPHGRYTYRFDAQMSVFADYIFVYQDNDEPGIDYIVNNPSVGIIYNFNPTLTGWPRRVILAEPRASERGVRRYQQPEHHAKGQADDIHPGLQQRIPAEPVRLRQPGLQQVLRRLGGHLAPGYAALQSWASLGAAQYTDYAFVDRNDWLYTADATASYQILKWLTVGGRVGYQQDDSSIAVNSYDEWHAFLTLTATFDNLLY